MFPLSLGYLIWLGSRGPTVTFEGSLGQRWALVAAGPITSVPLLLFAAGARRIPLSLTGVLQYLSPTLQLLLGVLLWHEAFPIRKLVGYGLIWLALVIYSAEGLWVWRRRARF
jgi:chloramphenicol-sensitive protein RarD